MKKNILKSKFVKIPSDINFIFIRKKKMLLILSSMYLKLLKLNTQIFVSKKKRTIIISDLPFLQIPKNKIKKLTAFQNTNKTLIKQSILEVSFVLYKKLKFFGVGFRVFNISNFNYQLLLFKLGYSHFIYFKVVESINVLNFKMSILFFFSNYFQKLTQTLSEIRLFKKPEPYKGKGILYNFEKVNLKKIKKI